MRAASLIAWREIRWEIFGDRGSILRTLIFALLPILFVFSSRGPTELTILVLAAQSAFVPALSGVALIASTFTQEKENGTLVPLLAAPVQNIDIVVGKLIGMVVPVLSICVATVTVFYLLASWRFGHTLVAHALPPTVLYGLVVAAFLYLLSAGSWVLIVAARVRSSRAGQQIAGLLIGLSLAVFGGVTVLAVRIAEGWGLVGLGLILLIADIVALDIARRVWRREEVLARL